MVLKGKLTSGRDNRNIVINGTKVVLNDDSNNIFTYDVNGNLTSTDHITLSPNEDPLVMLTQLGDVIVHPEGSRRPSSRFIVRAKESRFVNNVTCEGNLTLSGDLTLQGALRTSGSLLITDNIGNAILEYVSAASSADFKMHGTLLIDGGVTCAGLNKMQSLEVGTCLSKQCFVETINFLRNGVLKAGLRTEGSTLVLNVESDDGQPASGSLSLDNEGNLVVTAALSSDHPLTVVGSVDSVANFHCNIACHGGSLSFGSSATASLQFSSSADLIVSNDGGSVFVQAAGHRGMEISAVSGNASFNGTVTVQSALDMESTDVFNDEMAALNVRGGAIFAVEF